jgi:hypothetical protein
LFAFFISLIHSACPYQLILLHFTTLIDIIYLAGESWKHWTKFYSGAGLCFNKYWYIAFLRVSRQLSW